MFGLTIYVWPHHELISYLCLASQFYVWPPHVDLTILKVPYYKLCLASQLLHFIHNLFYLFYIKASAQCTPHGTTKSSLSQPKPLHFIRKYV